MQIHSVGIDLGKTTFHFVALGDNGKLLLKKKFTQKRLITFIANMQTSLIGMEACSGAHFLGRVLRKQGHEVSHALDALDGVGRSWRIAMTSPSVSVLWAAVGTGLGVTVRAKTGVPIELNCALASMPPAG
jgi:hypothetical protein